jgi:tetratricopeptide (TPR) repeat protein/CHAT domain-containing protein
MKCQLLLCGMIAVVLTAECQTARAQGEQKVHVVGKDGLTLQGKVDQDDPKVKVIVGDKFLQLPAKLFLVKLSSGNKYRISMDSKEIDSALVVQDKTRRQLAWDDDSGGGLNSLLTLDVLKDDTYKIYAASLKGAGNFTLKVREDGAIKVYEVGAGLKINGELGKVSAITYLVKLAAGKTYVIDMISPDEKALDPFLRLLDARGKQLAEDDDGGEGLNARIIYKAENTTAYQVVAMCFGQGRGAFTLTIREARSGERAFSKQEHERLSKARQLNDKVVALFRLGKVTEALKAAHEALAIHKEVLGEKHPDYAQSLHNVAFLYDEKGNYAKAEPLYRQALEIRKAVLGEKHPEYATSLNNLGFLYNSQGNFAKAEPLYRQALEIRKAVLGEKHPAYATTLNNLAVLYNSQGNDAKAEPLYRQALEIRKAVLGEKHPAYATTLNNLAFLYNVQGNYAKAEPLYRQAMEIRKAVLGEKHPEYATSLNNLGFLYNSQGNYAKAEPLYRQAMEIRKAVLGEKHPEYATSLNNLAHSYESQGNYTKAEPLYGQALEIRKAVLGEKHPEYAASLNNLAFLYNAQGNYAKAEPLFRQALDIWKAVLGEKHPNYAASLNNLAILYHSHRDYAKAEPLYRKALDIRKEVLGENHPEYTTSLNNLAALYKSQGNYAKAEPLYRKALEIYKAVLGEKHPDYARSLSNLANLHNSQGNYAKAEPLHRQALEIRKAVLGERHPDYARSLHNLAAVYNSQGNYAKAEPLFRQAVVTLQITKNLVPFEQLQTDDIRIDPDTLHILHSHALCTRKLAETNGTSERFRSCDRSFLLGLSVLDRVRQVNLDQEDNKIQLTGNWFDLVPGRIKVLSQVFVLEKKPEDLEAAFWTAEQGTARTFLESLGKSRGNFLAGVSAKHQTEEMDLLQDIRLLDLRLDKESARALDKRNPDLIGQLFSERREAEGKLKHLIGQLEKDYPQYAGLKYPGPCTLKQARECLKDDEVALLFVPGTEESFLVLVEARPKPDDKTNGLAIYELPGSAELAAHVAALNDLETLALPARVKALGRQAYDTLLGPCKDRIKGKNLVIVPGGSLGLLPFEMLVEEDGKYLIENHRIRYAPSLTALHFINLWKQKRAAPTEPLLAVGDPIYDGGDERVANPKNVQVASTSREGLRELLWREGKRDDLKRLVHSGKEVAKIADLLGAKDDYVLTGENASEAKIKEASTADRMAKARYVHFATHGILGVDTGKQPALVLNLVGNKAEDGFLELSEIANLKLNADLVVLSACRTGQGRMARGEGVTGLARAFLYAGSKGVVCSLWSVDDQETSNLMVDFYQQLQKGQSAPEALRAVQLAMIRAGKAPLYWAPFIVIGE